MKYLWFFFCINLHLLASEKANVLFILVDDLGWMDVGYQNTTLNTPNIDQLASSGMVFTQAYAAAVCSPSRASILTGRSPARLKITAHIPGIGFESYLKRQKSSTRKLIDAEIRGHLPLEEVTLAEVFKANGYRTGFFGKWHLAGGGSVKTEDGVVNEKWHPQHQGFDINKGGCAYGQPRKSYYSPYFNAELKDGPKGEYLTERLVDESIKFMQQDSAQPFFSYLSFYSIHTPLIPKKEILEKTKDKRTAMIETLDESIGKLNRFLEQSQLRDSTLVVFTSDNGGMTNQQPLRGVKGQIYEGGIRVPLLYSWPNKIKPGLSCDIPVGCEDFYPTLVNLLGLKDLAHAKLDGLSYSPLLFQQSNQHRPLYQHFPHHRNGKGFNGSSTIRKDEWKLIWWHESNRLELYNLYQDLSETKNLATEYPEKTQVLKQELFAWLKETQANLARPNPLYQP